MELISSSDKFHSLPAQHNEKGTVQKKLRDKKLILSVGRITSTPCINRLKHIFSPCIQFLGKEVGEEVYSTLFHTSSQKKASGSIK